MTILPAGTFKVSDYRKSIADGTKRAVLKRYRFDHRPPLQDRPYDTDAGDFIPPQNDPAFIEAIEDAEHDRRTFGRAPGAEVTVTTRGSDAHNRAHGRNVSDSEKIHRASIERKNGNDGEATRLLSSVTKKSRLKPSHKMQSRSFDRSHRPMRSRNALKKGRRND